MHFYKNYDYLFYFSLTKVLTNKKIHKEYVQEKGILCLFTIDSF